MNSAQIGPRVKPTQYLIRRAGHLKRIPTPLAAKRGKTLVTVQVFLVLLHDLRGGMLSAIYIHTLLKVM